MRRTCEILSGEGLRWRLAALLSAAGLAVVVGAGCATSGVVAGDASYSENPYVIVDDPVFHDQVSVVSVDHEFRGNLMRALVTLKSNRHRSLWIQYKFSWYDAKGIEIDPGKKPYRDLTIEGKDSITATSMAPSPEAKEFKIRIRKVKALKINNIL